MTVTSIAIPPPTLSFSIESFPFCMDSDTLWDDIDTMGALNTTSPLLLPLQQECIKSTRFKSKRPRKTTKLVSLHDQVVFLDQRLQDLLHSFPIEEVSGLESESASGSTKKMIAFYQEAAKESIVLRQENQLLRNEMLAKVKFTQRIEGLVMDYQNTKDDTMLQADQEKDAATNLLLKQIQKHFSIDKVKEMMTTIQKDINQLYTNTSTNSIKEEDGHFGWKSICCCCSSCCSSSSMCSSGGLHSCFYTKEFEPHQIQNIHLLIQKEWQNPSTTDSLQQQMKLVYELDEGVQVFLLEDHHRPMVLVRCRLDINPNEIMIVHQTLALDEEDILTSTSWRHFKCKEKNEITCGFLSTTIDNSLRRFLLDLLQWEAKQIGPLDLY